MSPNSASTGLGFEIPFSAGALVEVRTSLPNPREHSSTSQELKTFKRTVPVGLARSQVEPGAMSEQFYTISRSASGMEGLLQAEAGDAMVELDVFGGSSGFRKGHRIAVETVTPGGSSRKGIHHSASQSQQAMLSRHGTLLSTGATPERRAAELKSILGSANSRLKPGAAILPKPGQVIDQGPTMLEQAKSRARVGVDIVLYSNTCVQGGCLQGHVTVHIRKRLKDEPLIALSDGKVRVIGFESISNERQRYPFYQCSSLLSTITASSGLYREPQCDSEGFSQALEGRHMFPFSMYLPLREDHGIPKGVMHTQSGVAVRYIAMVSVKIKELESNNRSIAHFYRDCEIWPRLNPSVVLIASAQPLQMSTSRGLFRGGSGTVSLTASLHRPHWVAGQRCYVSINVNNSTTKTVKSVTLSLLRYTVVFKPDISLNTLSGDHDVDPDACQTSTSQKQVSESILEMSRQSTQGHASAKGWWTGVGPGEHLDFSHFIAIPPDTLSIPRSRLLEVNYSLRVTLSARMLKTDDVQVTLPIQIVNFLSVDPPPSSFPPIKSRLVVPGDGTANPGGNSAERSHLDLHSRPNVAGLFGSYKTNSRMEPVLETEQENALASEDSGTLDESTDSAYDGIDSEFYGEYYQDAIDDANFPSPHEDFSMYEDDDDEIVQYTYPTSVTNPENALRFSDLYYTSIQENLDKTPQDDVPFPESKYDTESTQLQSSGSHQNLNVLNIPTQTYPELLPNARRPAIFPRASRPHGAASFAQRVQEKIIASAAAKDPGNLNLTEYQGLSQSQAIPDPDDGSYFSARRPCDETVSNVQDVHSLRYDSATPASETCPSTSRGPYEPRLSRIPSKMELTASSAFSAVSCSAGRGSRLLPIPPRGNDDTPLDTEIALSVPPSPRLGDAAVYYADILETHRSGYVQPTETETGEATSGTCPGTTRPPLAPAVGGSACSVKDRINELEKRVKAVEAGEA